MPFICNILSVEVQVVVQIQIVLELRLEAVQQKIGEIPAHAKTCTKRRRDEKKVVPRLACLECPLLNPLGDVLVGLCGENADRGGVGEGGVLIFSIVMTSKHPSTSIGIYVLLASPFFSLSDALESRSAASLTSIKYRMRTSNTCARFLVLWLVRMGDKACALAESHKERAFVRARPPGKQDAA